MDNRLFLEAVLRIARVRHGAICRRRVTGCDVYASLTLAQERRVSTRDRRNQ